MALSASGFDERQLRDVFGAFPTGVVALSTTIDARPIGMAASSFIPVSLDPPLVSICIANSSSTWPRIRDAAIFGLSVLGEGHDATCRRLSGPEADRFTDVAWYASERGAVLLDDAAAWFECTLEREVPAGDHLIALFGVIAAELRAEIEPLVFHRSGFRKLHA
jgi:flavin reductase (DIM6/NTAB) family NADH-FMN oxidoreductase RutF